MIVCETVWMNSDEPTETTELPTTTALSSIVEFEVDLSDPCVSSTRPTVYHIATREHNREHLTGRLLHLPGGGLSSQPDLHLVLGAGQRLLQEVKL